MKMKQLLNKNDRTEQFPLLPASLRLETAKGCFVVGLDSGEAAALMEEGDKGLQALAMSVQLYLMDRKTPPGEVEKISLVKLANWAERQLDEALK